MAQYDEHDEHGWMILPGGTGVADQVYVCAKDDSDNYVWREVSTV